MSKLLLFYIISIICLHQIVIIKNPTQCPIWELRCINDAYKKNCETEKLFFSIKKSTIKRLYRNYLINIGFNWILQLNKQSCQIQYNSKLELTLDIVIDFSSQ